MNNLSRQGRPKGVHIFLLFHKASSIFICFHAESFRGIGDYCVNFHTGICKMDKRARTPKQTNKSSPKKPNLLIKYLNGLSRRGRQKGVRICLLFHKASSIFIGFHAGVNIESKTFLPHRPLLSGDVICPEQLFLFRCMMVRWKYEIMTFYNFQVSENSNLSLILHVLDAKVVTKF